MSLTPGQDISPTRQRIMDEELDKSFNAGSPYFDMYRCGYFGISLEDCVDKCKRNGIAVRTKDVENWENGRFKRDMMLFGATHEEEYTMPRVQVESMKLADFPLLPQGWKGTTKRFFPCNENNKPMQKWGWSKSFAPNLYTLTDAKALSPCGWVGQNMLYQNFIVIDIDGRGHGSVDQDTITFGRMFSDLTLTMEDPTKPDSFHLYFSTNRLIPVKHFPWAKIDFMGNAVNAAVYLKNKQSNGINMAPLTEEIWSMLIKYQSLRKEKQYVS